MSFEESLARVLDPDGLYWRYPGDEHDNPSVERLVEVRLDIPTANVPAARAEMGADGWQLASQPDDGRDPIQRLYFRRTQALTDEHRREMLESALKAANGASGRFWSWMNVEDLGEE